jgi:hypothetical protein
MSSVTTNAATNIGTTTATLNGSYSGSGGNLYFMWGYSSGNLAYSTGQYAGNQSGGWWYWNLTGLAANTTYYFQAQGYSYGYGSIRSFTTSAGVSTGPPSVFGENCASVGATTAQPATYVNPGGLATSTQFVYGTDPSCNQGLTPQPIAANAGNVAIYGVFTNLTPNTTYYWQVLAANSIAEVGGGIMSFTTASAIPPTVNTDAATSIGSTTATLQGDLNPNGFDTQGFFQWGTTTGYGNTTSNQDQGSGTSDVGFSQALTGLTTGATYHYRAVGTNVGGTNYGADAQFTVGLPSTTLSTPTKGYTAYFGTVGVTFVFAYVNNGATGAQLDYSLAVTNPAGTTYYWTGSAWSLSPTPWVTSSSGSITISAAQWSATFPSPGVYYWTAATQDANGKSAYAAQQSIINQGFQPIVGLPVHFIEDVVSSVPAKTTWLVWTYNGQLIAIGDCVTATVRPLSQWRNLSYNPDGTLAGVA